MANCPNFGCACAVCDQCTPPAPGNAAPQDSKSSEVQPTPGESFRAIKQLADATIVFVLGHLEETPGIKQVDEYSGLNGYHIRTIPGRRWATPIMVGAGAGYLAVVDHFQDYDLIRVTDKYGGAGTAGFDADGFPLDSVDWASLPDICSGPTPRGTRVTGLSIMPSGVLVATLSDTSSYMLLDVFGREHAGVSKFLEGARTLDEPYDVAGTLTGTPTFVDANAGALMFATASILISPDGKEALVLLIDTVKHKVIGLQGIPTTPTPISVTISRGVVSVLSGDNGIGTQIIRFTLHLDRKGILAGGRSDQSTPLPQDYTVDQFPTMKDLNGQQITPELLHKYYRVASIVNDKQQAETRNATIPQTFSNLPAVGVSSGVMSDNRVSKEAHVAVEYYNNITVPVQMIQVDPKLGLIALEGNFGTVTELFNRKTLDLTTGAYTGPLDRTKPIFRVLHGSHYDIVAEGGYTFGSDNTYGAEDTRGASNTSGLVGESLAVDTGYETGTLKTVDAKAALVESGTGLLFFREPKPRGGYRVYGGNYAALDPLQTNSALEVEILAIQDDLVRLRVLYDALDTGWDAPEPNPELQAAQTWLATLQARLAALGMTGISVRRTQATLDAENAAMAVDGVERSVVSPWESPWLVPKRTTAHGAPVAAFDEATGSMDDYWSMYVRSPGVSDQFDAALMRRTWSSMSYDEMGNAVFLPEWAASNESPISFDSAASSDVDSLLLVPWSDPEQPIAWPPRLNCVGRGGFFVRGLPYVWISNVDRYNEEASALADLNAAYQRVVEDPASTPAIVTQYSGYITENVGRIAYIRTVPLWGDIPLTPRSILGMKFRKLDKSEGQNIAAPIGDDMTLAPSALTPGATIPIGAVTGKRGCVIKGGPMAFVAVTIKLQADSLAGMTRWGNPEARRNGLGIKVGEWSGGYSYDPISGSIYEAGYECSQFGAGAWGTWGYTIEGGPKQPKDPLIDIHDLGVRELFVNMLAPEDAKAILLGDVGGDIGSKYDEIFQKTHYFLTQTPLESITVKFWLRNHAADVFRWGWSTLSHTGKAAGYPTMTPYGVSGCYTIDPGFNTGNADAFIYSGCGGTWPDLSMGPHHLFATDPTYPQLGHDVLMGTAVFKCAPSPYPNLAYGSIWKCSVDFNLNNNLRAIDVPLLPSDVEKPGT